MIIILINAPLLITAAHRTTTNSRRKRQGKKIENKFPRLITNTCHGQTRPGVLGPWEAGKTTAIWRQNFIFSILGKNILKMS